MSTSESCNVVGDSTGPQWSFITWKSSNCVRDTDGLKNALRVSKETVKQLSLFCHGHQFRLSKFVQELTTCTNLQSITLDGVTYTELQIGKVLQLPELRYLYLDTTQLCRYQGRITEHVFANCDKNMETLCIKNSSRYALKCISFWARTGYFPADLRLIIRMSYYDHMSLSHALSESIQQAPSTSVSYVSVYNQVCGKEFLQLQYQISPSGVTLLSCSDLQLTVASAKPGANEMISGKYLNATLQGNVKFSDVCCKVYELDLSGNKSLVPSLAEE